MTDNLIKVSVVGVGYWGPNIIRNFIANPHTTVDTICDIRRERIDAIRSIYPFLNATQEYREVVRSENNDLVAICTPVFTHYEIAKEALLAGKHVLLTKPMTSTTEQAEDLVNLAEKKGLKIFVDHTFMYHGAVKKMKELLQNGQIGDLYYFDSVRVNLGLFQHDVNVVWDLAPHDISIMYYLLDQYPESVIATGADHFKTRLEDMAYLTVFYPNNLIAHIHVNWLSPVKIRQTLIAGSKRMVVWDDNEPSEKVRIYDKGIEIVPTPDEVYDILIQYRTGDMYCPKIDTKEALAVEVEDIVRSIQQGNKPISNGEVGLMIVKILEAAQYSIKHRGKEVKI